MDRIKFHTAELSVGGVVKFELLPLPLPDLNADQSEPNNNIKFYLPGDITKQQEETIFLSNMGHKLPNVDAEIIETTFDKLSLMWTEEITLTIIYTLLENGNRYDIEWYTDKLKEKTVLRDAVSLEGAKWFGGGVTGDQRWPLELKHQQIRPFVTGDAREGRFGGVMERYWLSSSGIGILVHGDCPLHVGTDEKGNLIFESKWQPPFIDIKKSGLALKYSIFQSHNILDVHNMVSKHFPRPRDIPDELSFRNPSWSTLALEHKTFDQQQVIAFAKQIKDFNIPITLLEMDDFWMETPGDLVFKKKQFPDPKHMMEVLEKMGVRVSLAVHVHCTMFSDVSKEKSHWLESSLMSGYSTWWRGLGKMLDMTNIDAVRWYLKRLVNFKKQYKILTFSFDGGEVNWIPKWPRFKEPPSDPCEYTRSYAALAAAADTKVRAQQVRIGNRTQHLGILVRIPDKASVWGYENGLKSVIPTVLTYGLLGYPFVLCDIISSGTYFSDKVPSKELYIRWLELAVFMPAIQFTHVPWSFDDETLIITRKYLKLREQYADVIINLARDCVRTGHPIVRPLWWVAPEDEIAFSVDSQFLVGDEIMVAPILEEGSRKRDIYLPHGRWRDMLRNETLIGGRWRKDYITEIHELPYFVKVKVKLNIIHQNNNSF